MLTAREIKERLTEEEIIQIVRHLGAESYFDVGDALVFPTICHNPLGGAASMKMYYYKNSRLFFCYTECSESFDIFELVRRVSILNKQDLPYGNTFYGAFHFVLNFFNIESNYNVTKKKTYTVIRDRFKRKNYEVILDEYNPVVLEVFRKHYTCEWLSEGITKEAMDKFNILYYDYRNEIVIPHYDIDDRLVGIRSRALNDDSFAKYMPTMVENKVYKHPLSFNLYGLNVNKKNIEKVKTAIVFEGEKSILKSETLSDINYSVAVCGSRLNIFQVNMLIRNCGVREIILAFDKEYINHNSSEGEEYFNKLERMARKYKNYCAFSFIYDMKDLLQKKDSPVDRGKEVYEQLLLERIFVKV